jgi:hypothetical protein
MRRLIFLIEPQCGHRNKAPSAMAGWKRSSQMSSSRTIWLPKIAVMLLYWRL